MESIKDSLTPNATYSVLHSQQDSFNQFYPITLSELLETVSYMRVSSSLLDVISTTFLLKVMESVGPCLLSVFNSSLSNDFVPDYFKTACVHPLLKKKPWLDPSLLQNNREISKSVPFVLKFF